MIFCIANEGGAMQIDSGISQAVKGADKISMVKNIFGNERIETTLTAEKTTSFKRNTTYLAKLRLF